MATLNLNIAIQVTNGPQINVNRAREIEAFDKVDVSLAGGATRPICSQASPSRSRCSSSSRAALRQEDHAEVERRD